MLVKQMLMNRQCFGSIRKILLSIQHMSTIRPVRSKSVDPNEISSPERPLFPTSGRATSAHRRRRLVGPNTSTFRPEASPEIRTCESRTIAYKWRTFALRLYTVFQVIAAKSDYLFYLSLAKKFLYNQIIGSGENRAEVDIFKSTFSKAKMIQNKREAKVSAPISMDPIFRIVWNPKARCNEVATYKMDKPGKHTPTVDPAICAHPEGFLEVRGNNTKTEKGQWFLCAMCQTRWIRHSLKQPAGVPNDDHRLNFGRHIGQRYDYVYANHFSYEGRSFLRSFSLLIPY